MALSYSNNKKFSQGLYHPENPAKYKGKTPVMFRSSWERRLMLRFDRSPSILEWSSESLFIGYINPLTGRPAKYYPDFLIKYINHEGKETIELIEVKPYKQTVLPNLHGNKKQKTLLREAKTWVVNEAKWKAAEEYCRIRNIRFRIVTEKDLGI